MLVNRNQVLGPLNFSNSAKFILPLFFALCIAMFINPFTRYFVVYGLLLFSFLNLFIRFSLIIITLFKNKTTYNILNDNFSYNLSINKKYLNINTADSTTSFGMFSILIPMYKENQNVINSIFDSIKKIQYPREYLDIKIILEENDRTTIQLAQAVFCNQNFIEIIIVPDSIPKTKPKACNYAMSFAKGEYIGIYDAEDIPNTKQLLAVNDVFQKYKNISCIQCPLLFYNANQNILTKFFQMEYFTWFKLTLSGLSFLDTIIALGGTSNFIRKDTLNKVGLWSAHNVTEDAELGTRLFVKNAESKQKSFGIAFLDVETMEEFQSSFLYWLNQRRRWIKGFNQTYFFYFLKFFTLKTSIVNKLIFFVLYGFSAFGFLVNIILILFSILFIQYNSSIPILLEIICILNLPISMSIAFFGFYLQEKYHLISCIFLSFLSIFYFQLHSIATIFAIYDIITKPFHWHKTHHNCVAE